MGRGLNVRPYDNKRPLLFPASVGDYLEEGHLAHIVDEVVEEIDLSSYYKNIPSVGNPSYHPALMIKIWFYGYATKVYSSRKIEEKLRSDIAFIYLSGMEKPDFKTISEFRRKNINALRDTFVEILQICNRIGMTRLGTISIDSKVMKGNASSERTYTEEEIIKEQEELEGAIKEYLERAEQVDEEEDKRYGSEKSGNELPEGIREKEKRIKEIEKEIKKLEESKKKLREGKKKKINLTDASVEFQKDKTRKIPGYRAHTAVDSKEQVIVANDVTEKQSDCCQLIPMVEEVLKNIEKVVPEKREKINIVADSGYSSGKNFASLERKEYKEKIEAYIPDVIAEQNRKGKGSSHKQDNRFDKSNFIYNKEEKILICPGGQELHHIGRSEHREVVYDTYGNVSECKKCEYYGVCTTSPRGRHISISEHEGLFKEMREKLSTEEGKEIYGIRKITSEPVFGNLSQNLGFREFVLRGKEKVRGEFSLMCTAHNLLKIAKFVRKSGKKLGELLKEREVLSIGAT